jgi:integrase
MARQDGVYQRRDRDGYWVQWVGADGKRRVRKVEGTLTQARKRRRAELTRSEEAKALGFNPPGEETFSEVARRYLQHQKARLTPKAYEREEGIVEKHLKPFFAGKLAAIRRVDVQRYITSRSAGTSPYSIQKELNTLKHLLRLSVEWQIIPFHPVQGVRGPKTPAGRVRYLQPSELRVLMEACPDWLRPVVGLAVSTGMRRSEILRLRWLDVDLANQRVLLPQTKNGEGRIVYLNELARGVVRSLPFDVDTRATDRLFPAIKPAHVSVAFQRACRKAKIEDFRLHDLRHTAASWMRMQGADIHTVAQLLGHKDLRMAARYQHLSPAFLAEAVGRLDSIFGEYRYPRATEELALEAAEKLSA